MTLLPLLCSIQPFIASCLLYCKHVLPMSQDTSAHRVVEYFAGPPIPPLPFLEGALRQPTRRVPSIDAILIFILLDPL